MKFKELVMKYDWEDIYKRFFKLYPDQKKNGPGYKKILDKTLPLLKPKKSNFRIVVHTIKKDKWNEKEYVSVSGGDERECDISYLAIEFTPWEQWLDSYIDIGSLFEFQEIDILCHCLWEMTWCGFEQKTVKKHIDELNLRAKQVKSNPKKYTTPYGKNNRRNGKKGS